MNILVGPKQFWEIHCDRRISSSFCGIKESGASRNPEFHRNPRFTWGYRIPRASLPITLENAQTDYQDVEATVTFRLTNGNRLRLSFTSDADDCILYPVTAEGEKVTRAKFNRQFPISLLVVPVLGPVDNREKIVKERQWMKTWRPTEHHAISATIGTITPGDFEAFRQQVIATWPGMDISPPESIEDGRLSMFCLEDRITRELYWTGYGFQVWCQLLSHTLGARAGQCDN